MMRVVAGLLVSLAAVLTYASTLHHYFLADDFGVVQLLSQKPALYFPKWFFTPWMDRIWGFTPDEIRPFPAISFQLSSLWGAASPLAHHAFNIALHVLSSLLVFIIALRVAALTLLAAAFAGMLFAVLPAHAETVAWITGRVDSIPALFYLASFLAYAMWRRSGAGWYYRTSVGMLFLALFSKQTAVTLLPALVLYDLVVERRALRFSWPWLRDYVPFAVLTGSFLILRYALFGQVVRESAITAQTFISFGTLQAKHLQTVVFGSAVYGRAGVSPAFNNTALALTCIAIALTVSLIGYVVYCRARGHPRGRIPGTAGLLLYFGPVWWIAGTAPTAVAGYESARHLYLAAVGFSVLLGLGFQALVGVRWGLRRYAAIVASCGLIVLSVVRLKLVLVEWNTSASVSKKMVYDVEREMTTAPAGSLFLLDAPIGTGEHSNSLNPHYVWAWALPFALQPPFSSADLSKRVFVISPSWAYCCAQWFHDVKQTVQLWSERAEPSPAVALRWDASTGSLRRQSDAENSRLRDNVLSLTAARTTEEMDKALRTIFDQLWGL